MTNSPDLRPDWDTHFMNIANVAATRSNCCRRKVAAVIARDWQVISTGYNGASLEEAGVAFRKFAPAPAP